MIEDKYEERGEHCPECEHPYRGFGWELSESAISSLSPQCTELTVVKTVAPPKAQIFNVCWNEKGKLGAGGCPMPASMPAIKPGTIIDIKADIVNTGTTGRVMVVFKIDGVSKYTETNENMVALPAGGVWSPVYSGFTMPSKDVSLIVEAHNWDGSKWVLGVSLPLTISITAAGCTGLDLLPYSDIIMPGAKVTFTVRTSPGNVPFTATIKDRTGTVLATCKTSGTGTETGTSTCQFTWDSTGKPDGVYYFKAYADSCISLESVVSVDSKLTKLDFNITVRDSATSAPIYGATVMITPVGGSPESKTTDTNGLAQFKVSMGTINVSISKSGYNTYNTIELVYNHKSIPYYLIPTPPVPTAGSIMFVSVPTSASIYIDEKATNKVTPVIITDVPAGEHTWRLKLTGYNDSSGKVIVPSGGSESVYTTLTPITPTAGSLNITSTPVGASVWVDGKDMKVTTSGMTIITDIPPGSHTYLLKMTGFENAEGTFEIKAGQTTYLNVVLVPIIPITAIGTLDITSQPSGARVFLDDKDTEKVTPATITKLTAEDHKYKLTLSGYKDVSGIVTIEAEKTKTVHIILEKTGIPGAEMLVAGAAAVAILAFMARKREV